jgi:hypothetical protein
MDRPLKVEKEVGRLLFVIEIADIRCDAFEIRDEFSHSLIRSLLCFALLALHIEAPIFRVDYKVLLKGSIFLLSCLV